MKKYIGDNVYAFYDGYDITLTTENDNKIIIVPEVWKELRTFVKFIDAKNDIKKQGR